MPTNTENVSDLAGTTGPDFTKPAEPKPPASVAAAEATAGLSSKTLSDSEDKKKADEDGDESAELSLRAAERPEETGTGAAPDRQRMGLSETAPVTLGRAAANPHLGAPGVVVPNEE